MPENRLDPLIKALVAVTLAVAVAGGGTVHADDPPDKVTWTSTVIYADEHQGDALAAGDPISATFRLNSNYWKCAGPTPTCWHVSTLSFFQVIDLQYHHHKVRGKSAITSGTVPWGAWTAKRQTLTCHEAAGQVCGPIKVVPHPKNRWSAPVWYTAFLLMSNAWFRLQASACFDDWCGTGQGGTARIYCRAAQRQCYFDL